MKKILFPTDFSAHAKAAQRASAVLAKRFEAQIDCLHVLDSIVDIKELSEEDAKRFPELDKKLKKTRNKLSQSVQSLEDEGVQASSSLHFNEGWQGLNRYLKDGEHDFIVLGSHGDSGVHEFFIGSNAQRIVRKTSLPVLVLKEHERPFRISRIAFPTDLSEESGEALETVLEFATAFDAEVEVFFVNTPSSFEISLTSDAILGEFLDKYSKYSHRISTRVFNYYDVEGGILAYADLCQADLIAMFSHNRRGIKGLLAPHYAETVLNHSPANVMVLR